MHSAKLNLNLRSLNVRVAECACVCCIASSLLYIVKWFYYVFLVFHVFGSTMSCNKLRKLSVCHTNLR